MRSPTPIDTERSAATHAWHTGTMHQTITAAYPSARRRSRQVRIAPSFIRLQRHSQPDVVPTPLLLAARVP